MDKPPKVIKKSPFVIVKSLLGVELAAVVIYFIAGLVGHYAKIYRSLPFADLISFQIAQAIFIFICQTLILVIIFLKWSSEAYTFKDERIVYTHGVFRRVETSYLLENIKEFKWQQGLLGRIAHYGHIYFDDGSGKKVLRYIPEADKYANFLNEAKKLESSTRVFTSLPSIQDLISKEEHENLEFKSSFRWDVKENRLNKNLEKSAMKTIAAFLNSGGGHLVLGVDDTKNVAGLEKDFDTLGKPNADGFENHFSHIFHNMIGPSFRHYVRLTYADMNDKSCCVVSVSPSSNPVYLKTDDRTEEFYIRTGNTTTALRLSEVNQYIRSRFHKS